MKYSPLGLGLSAAGLVLSLALLSACGGEDAPPAANDSTREAAQLTAEEAAHLEAFRASRAAKTGEAKPAANPTTDSSAVDPNRPAWDVASEAIARQKSDQAPTPKPEPTNPAPTPKPKPIPQPQPSLPSADASGAVAFEKHTLKEQSTGMPAYTVWVPKGWTIEASVQRTPPQLAAMFSFADILISAPDGREIHFYPSMTFHYSDHVNAQPMQPVYEKFFLPPPNSIGDLLLQFAQMEPDSTIKNLRIVSEEEVPELTQQIRQLAAGTYQSMAQMQQAAQPGDQMGFDTKGVKVVVRYEQDGQPKEETFVAQYQIMLFSTPTSGSIVQWGIYNMRSVSGPVGSPYNQDPTLITIAQSMQNTPQWAKATHDYYVARAPRPSTPQPTKPGKSPAEIDAETRENALAGWKSNQAISDGMTSREVDMIYEQTPYTDSDGSTVRLSSHWNHVASDGQGTILMHNDANWNPNTDRNWNQRDWQTLNPQH